jgi:hypothetical protein
VFLAAFFVQTYPPAPPLAPWLLATGIGLTRPVYFSQRFHNQLHGRIRDENSRYDAPGAAEVVIVNPDPDAAKRIKAVAGPNIRCSWIPKKIKDWVNDDETHEP